MRANSVEGILMVAAYSVSGMPSLQAHASISASCSVWELHPSQDVCRPALRALMPHYRSVEVACATCAGAVHR